MKNTVAKLVFVEYHLRYKQVSLARMRSAHMRGSRHILLAEGCCGLPIFNPHATSDNGLAPYLSIIAGG
jgi:hypothetical protein